MQILMVAFGGALGAIARYLTFHFVKTQTTHSLPISTFIVNVVGCFLVGSLMILIERAIPFHKQILMIGVIGFFGSYTTFSAFGFDTLNLIKDDQLGFAALNICANVVVGLFAVWSGQQVMRLAF